MDTTAKVTLTGTRPGRKRIAIFLDGTWNTVNDNTNVWRLKSLLADTGADGVPQLGYYQKGVGTTFGSYLLGGVLGSGLQDEIITAYEWLIDHYSEGDELFIFGFSRGAYTARSLSGLISKCGLITIGAPLSVNQLYDRYRKAGVPLTIRQLLDQQAQGKTDFGFEERWILKYALPIDIDFLGVWDTVGALGLPFGNLPILGKQDMQFLNTGLRTSNKFASTRWRSTRTARYLRRPSGPSTIPTAHRRRITTAPSTRLSKDGSSVRTRMSAAATKAIRCRKHPLVGLSTALYALA
jgi:uncharacterized protein (DUF2235 family)